MNLDQPFSPAQCVGYGVVFVGVAAFLQKSDQRLRCLNAISCLLYAVHFLLLHNPTAASSSLVSSVRSFTSMQTRSAKWAIVFLALNIVLGCFFAKGIIGWIPVLGSCCATYAVFLLKGIPLRLLMLAATSLWLANNILSGSIGGTVLETAIAAVNISTILRLHQPQTTPAEKAA